MGSASQDAAGMPLVGFGPEELAEVMRRFADALASQRDLLDRLNVYPVPDGDTGSNLALTLASVTAEFGSGPLASMRLTCEAISRGSLMGARGNSGVIVAQILGGFAKVAAVAERLDATGLSEALRSAAVAAYEAVSHPVEGTILTVARLAADAATTAAAAGSDMAGVLRAARDAAVEAVARTPEQLPVLAAAGVVDAGGAGLALLFDAALSVAEGRPASAPSPGGGVVPDAMTVGNPAGAVSAALVGGDDLSSPGLARASGPRFEVMFLLATEPGDAGAAAVAGLRRDWEPTGESVVVVGDDDLWNCHVHTDDIGAVLEAALAAGRPRAIRVTDLTEQVAHRHGAGTGERTAVVAVAQGDGMCAAFEGLGATVVRGGQGANPSTAELVAALEACGTPDVVLLPDNSNIVAVAEQAAAVASVRVHVVPTHSVLAGIAALASFDPVADGETNREAMGWSSGDVVALEITRAVRPGHCDAGEVNEGDWLALVDGRATHCGADGVTVVREALEGSLADEHGLVTVFEGDGANEAMTSAMVAWLADVHPEVDVEVHHGGQPLYPYLIGIE
jgi:uncharacterized protein